MADDKPRVEKVSIALTADMAAMVRGAVDSGEYASASEVVREALRDWKYKQQERDRKIAELKALIDEGERSSHTVWEGADAILAKARQRAGK
ncbi:type II toxin-antitoxin system ParD family antitoxin [Asticcacaulis sp. AND118]|uniref:type II toxin-antitoxin system ParD family antitoxin n=1 Tax=Asticcacaulis sp. AND118 TaxID=2840468 RepID=UPI001CFF7291|nr:type II toxin-antitoxin system ParD family antitoxin [Asticcacaulis sp. AND118]UDF04353.1 type II toxin-antitoxin system ParD family antitoxin [Asticcacaulis sp. AND118]